MSRVGLVIGRGVWRLFVQGAAWMNRRRRIEADTAPVKVNLGSGLCVARGWMNVDGSVHALCAKWPTSLLRWIYNHSTDCRNAYSEGVYLAILRQHQFVHHGLEYGVPYGDGTIDFIYSSHMLEHLFKENAEILLRDAYRALKTGGCIRIAVPDLDYAVKLYQKGAKEEAMAYFFSVNRAGWLNQHHYMYDFDLLRQLLVEAGFVEIERCAYRVGRVPDLTVLDNRPDETLFVEASKRT